MILNDIKEDQQKLAFLLSGSVELYRGKGQWISEIIGVIFTVAISLVVAWYLYQPPMPL